MNTSTIQQLIKRKKAKICIVGLGYVGLPLAEAFARRGFTVYGFDTNRSRIEKIKAGKQYIVDVDPHALKSLVQKGTLIPTTQEKIIGQVDVVIVCVPTPVRRVKVPDISYVVLAAQMIRNYLRKGQLIILESTSYPRTTREVVLPILRKSRLKEEKDFFLCFSPERVNPGQGRYPLTKIPKLVGGLSARSTRLAKSLYSTIIKEVHMVSSPEVAESAKLLENTFRLVNIALANEFAMVCQRLGISVWEVIAAASTKPFGFMPFSPGPGVGGHCIPHDPLYLSWKAQKLGFKTKMIDLASFINHFMPHYCIERVKEILREQKKFLKGSKILVVGVTYKKDVKDLRESPALDIIEDLQRKGVTVSYYDPLIPYLKIKKINLKRVPLTAKTIAAHDCVVIVTDHANVNYARIRKHAKRIFDTRNIYKPGGDKKVVSL